MKFTKSIDLLKIIVIITTLLLLIIKLDRHYYFTDEILYVESGLSQFQGNFADTLQVPPLPKYLAGLSHIVFGGSLGLMRLPFAFLSFATAYVIYLILKKEYNTYFALVGMLLYVTSRIIFDSTRMIMLEPVMHFFWIFFLYFFYDTFHDRSRRYYLFSGLFLGLSLLTKLTSIVLVVFIIIGFIYKFTYRKLSLKTLLVDHLYMFFVGIATVITGYLHFFSQTGISFSITETLKAIKDVYLLKSEEGKTHILNGSVFTKSPWWSYLYHHVEANGIFRTVVYSLTMVLALLKRNFFVLYWLVFFILVVVFHQFSGVKNARYISSMEIPLIILSVSGINYLYLFFRKKFKSVYFIFTIFLVLAIFLVKQILYLYNLKYTEYEGLYRYFRRETNNFVNYKRMYVFGSVRSMKYYRSLVPNTNMLLWRKDYNIMCPEFDNFDYFAFDKEELLKDQDNFLFQYVLANIENFEQASEVDDMLVYKKIRVFESKLKCLVDK